MKQSPRTGVEMILKKGLSEPLSRKIKLLRETKSYLAPSEENIYLAAICAAG